MIKVDCLGDACPIPIMKLQNQLSTIADGESLMLVTDHSCTLGTVIEFCKLKGLSAVSDEVIPGVWEITVTSKSCP